MYFRNPRKLMVLAGYSGVGKTSLTCYCLRNQIALFGHSNTEAFFGFKIPSQFPEWKLDIKTIITHKYWFSTPHLPMLHRLNKKLDCALIHIDLLGLITNNYLPQLSVQEELVRYPRTMDSLRSEKENFSVISAVLNNNFLRSWDEVIVNTLYVPYERNCQQWHSKNWKAGAKSIFFNLEAPEEGIHRAAYSAWDSYIEAKLRATSLVSRIDDGKLYVGPQNRRHQNSQTVQEQ